VCGDAGGLVDGEIVGEEQDKVGIAVQVARV
jgi:hypothetical protein